MSGMEVGQSNKSREKKIQELRNGILLAEKQGNEDLVLTLEAELRAVEKGEVFNPKKTKPISTHKILRELQNIPIANENGKYADMWGYDGLNHELYPERVASYEDTFRKLLLELKVKSFKDLISEKSKELKRDLKVLDLFGGAYFLDDLTNIAKILGVRLKNVDSAFMESYTKNNFNRKLEKMRSIVSSPKRFLLEGNLYEGKTWIELGKDKFDVIVCRPEGPFGNSPRKNAKDVPDGNFGKEKIFISLLERSLSLLSEDGGMLFTQIPYLNTDQETYDNFWKDYIKKKEQEGYKFFFGIGRSVPTREYFAVQRFNK